METKTPSTKLPELTTSFKHAFDDLTRCITCCLTISNSLQKCRGSDSACVPRA